MCLRLKSFRWQPMFIAVNHAFTASCNVHYQCDTMPQYLIEQCLLSALRITLIQFLCSWSEDLHHIRHCTATSLSDLSQIWRFFFFNLKRFDTIWCRHFLRTNAAIPNSRTRQIGHSPRSARPQNLRGWSMLIALSILANDKCMLHATASYSFLQLHVFQMCRICLSLPRTHRKVLAWHAHNVGQIVHTNYTLGLAKCDHCDNMWHALYGSYMHAPIFSAVQLPLSSLRASLSFRDVSQVLLPQQRRQRLLRGIIPCCWSSVVIWCSFSKFIVLPLLCL